MEEQQIQAAASEATEQIQSILDPSSIDELKRLQLLILGRLGDSNAVLSHYNEFSERSFAAVAPDFAKNTKLLKSMKADLDHIFKHIRIIKNRIQSQFPDAFSDHH
ncbi:kxDL motif-containing protein CG10681-like isoform X2 [Selaginella moellendorffii]|uniref:kxDL motif-containing protein CG10681-like isoform X2 n=1 Tax=Selaginella moellendorffii TaxID=88036 RepID=UPI000D1C2CC5|nr:kxDL motif-containing protein CG10681-like isoform X2 [Selaginella moellendorffii]XP_024515904.1 kxDL motif-containing protein CG10681-like isoform X2 [Selaginella moellendorffii]|eukprot:XP_024514771.1 kxDL motif-containing protein CG10681-like isoform X2 [Selaginella moellendorffii]